jgi:hypothetical protein
MGSTTRTGGTGRLLFTSSPSKFLVARRHSCARDENGATMRKRADVGGSMTYETMTPASHGEGEDDATATSESNALTNGIFKSGDTRKHARAETPPTLRDAAWDWISVQACIVAGIIVITGYFSFISTGTWRKCVKSLDVDLRDASGREEVIRTFLRCTFARERGKNYRPWRMGDFSVLFVRLSTITFYGEVIFHQMSAWHVSKYRKWRTKFAVQSFAQMYIVYFVMISILGYHSTYSHIVVLNSFSALFLCGATAKEFWNTKGLSWFWTYFFGPGIIGRPVVEFFLVIVADPNVSAPLKLAVRFIFLPLLWETFRGFERHFTRLNPSPGPCLNLPYFISSTLQESFVSRYVMFLLSAGGAVKSMATVQAILALHELMMNVVQKDRDVHLVKLFLGKQSAEALLVSRKQHDIVALNSIVSSFAEICAIIVISLYLYVFRMASEGNEDVVDLKAYGVQAINLIAIEMVLSFFIMYVQQRFHGIRHGDVFPKGYFLRKGRWLAVSYKFVVFLWITAMMAHKVTIYLVGNQFHKYLCPRINDDGSVFTFQCSTEDYKLAPGGFYYNSEAWLIQQYDYPVAVLSDKG